MAQEPPKQALGKNIRDLINPALDDDRRMDIQKKSLDRAFAMYLPFIPQKLEQDFKKIFNHVAKIEEKKPEAKNPVIIDALTSAANEDGGLYNPILKLPLQIATGFTEFTAADINNLPSYIKLHEIARELDVAVSIRGLLAEDVKSSGGLLPPILIIDASKSYEQGAIGNTLYPNLPEPKAKFDPKQGKSFDL